MKEFKKAKEEPRKLMKNTESQEQVKGGQTLQWTEKRMTNLLAISDTCGENVNFILFGICLNIIYHHWDYKHTRWTGLSLYEQI